MTIKIEYIISIFLIITLSAIDLTSAQHLEESSPEKEGVSSGGIIDFINAANNSASEFHSFMFLRHGKIIAKGCWNPYSPDLLQKLYSVSKSFTSTAIGFAVSEGKLNVNDKVISFFPDKLPDTINSYLKEMKIKDLLIMASGQDPEPTRIMENTDDWVESFLAQMPVYEPGTRFAYNSAASYMLSAIIQKVTGEKIIDYLAPRLFDPLGITGADWETDPNGINKGGWGLRLHIEDMAKFGQFYLQNGKWNGKQLLPEEWIKEATSGKIVQLPADTGGSYKNDWNQGYCYQFWRCTHNAYRADGAYGQLIIVIPGADAVIAITSETKDIQDELNLVWKHLLPACNKSELPENAVTSNQLKKLQASLALPVAPKTFSDFALSLSGKIYKADKNEQEIEKISFNYRDDKIYLNLGEYTFTFGGGKWEYSETLRRDPAVLKSKSMYKGYTKTAGSYKWLDDKTLELKLRYIESPHSEIINLKFNKDDLLLEIRNSVNNETIKLTGKTNI